MKSTTTLILAAALASPLAAIAQSASQDETRRIPAAKDGAAPNGSAAAEQ